MKIEIEIDDSLMTTHKPVAIRKPENGEIVRWNRSLRFEEYDQDDYVSNCSVIWEKIKQYREPVLPADAGKECEFSDTSDWTSCVRHKLIGVLNGGATERMYWYGGSNSYRHARIEVTDEV